MKKEYRHAHIPFYNCFCDVGGIGLHFETTQFLEYKAFYMPKTLLWLVLKYLGDWKLTVNTTKISSTCWRRKRWKNRKKQLKKKKTWERYKWSLPLDLRTKRAPASTSFWVWSCCKPFGFSDVSCTVVEVGSSVPIFFLLLYEGSNLSV